jgi:hypothetical protein
MNVCVYGRNEFKSNLVIVVCIAQIGLIIYSSFPFVFELGSASFFDYTVDGGSRQMNKRI